ncbi:hypothetical protein [Terrisporobacter mayombei]|uniref:HTH araC/xylS-type domain-containing protein n=1 Tax=Terrisporobacter mayombei TaxID=1541 RepID=A0ABY9Q0C5_9FIRM|nr:hypothetical protein [Terrisporobacter mayombei]MCC3868552.1 hypothetical protein [Terrisporobacter mayombei]WMT80709.1 hypothetical protein TEMA_10300 [Terrisporobacter mayombei]
MKFYQWYSQACGGILGIISCIYCYLRGDLLIYSNLNGNFDIISFNGILASYILYPLCFLTFIMAIVMALPNTSNKKILSVEITKINSILIYLTTLVGILGCNVYFIIPALLLLIKDLMYAFKYCKSKINNNQTSTIKNNDIEKDNQELSDASEQLLSTKTEMAINLLNKNANINFITEVTGLSEDFVSNLKRVDLTKK